MNQRSITRRGCLDWLGYLPYTQVVMGSNPIPSIQFTGLYRILLFFIQISLCKYDKIC